VQYTGTNRLGVSRVIDGVVAKLSGGKVKRAAAASLRKKQVRPTTVFRT
jgi:hypothetical protein